MPLPPLELIPVIEVEPFSFSKSKYTSPKVSCAEDPEGWERYKQRCYSDYGLVGMKSITTGAWLYQANTLSEKQLYIIYKNLFNRFFETPEHLKEMLSDMEEYAPLISGGFMVKGKENILSLPGCCCGLESIHDWGSVLLEPENKSGEIWIGHDTDCSVQYIRYKDSIELNIENAETYLLSDLQYQRMIHNATIELQHFIPTLGAALNRALKIENGNKLARIMIFRE